jgi:Ni/Fe-hydrogenase subunit HybB-like protein
MEKTSKRAVTSNGSAPKLSRKIGEFFRFIIAELKPKGRVLTPFNVISGAIILLGAVLVVIRFAKGLGAVTNLNQDYPWGLWIGFDVVTGVAFAGGAYVLTFVVHVLRFKKYEPIVRATVLNGFLAYVFYAGALLLDLGRPWNVVNPIIGKAFGLSSVLFLVAWHFMLYMICEFIEFAPAVAEWLNWKRVRTFVSSLTMGAVIFGITLSTLHQSGLGALFLMAPSKIHPLWYSANIPVLFFVSSIFAGLSMVIIESSISHKIFNSQIDPEHRDSHGDIVLGLGKGAACALFVYIFLKVIDFVHGRHWEEIGSPMGYWYLVETVGFVVAPAALFAFKWYEPVRYYPSWIEVEVTLAVICMEIWVFRWVVNRMPVLRKYREPEIETGKEEEVVKWKVSHM